MIKIYQKKKKNNEYTTSLLPFKKKRAPMDYTNFILPWEAIGLTSRQPTAYFSYREYF